MDAPANGNSPTITFYDIILDPAAYPMSPNPWKTRYALNFAGVPYRTTWVPLNAIAATRSALGLPAIRKHADGSDFPTLPIIRDPLGTTPDKEAEDDAAAAGENEAHQPPPSGAAADADAGTVALHRAFNALVDELFTRYGAPLAGTYMPFDPRTAAADKAAMLVRFPGGAAARWEDLEIPPGSEARRGMLREFEDALEQKLGSCFGAGAGAGRGCGDGEERRAAGPFMGGRGSPMYADFIVGGWLQFMRGCLPEWEEMRDKWSGGKWGRLFDALEEWAQVDGRDGVVPARR
ncbi:46bd918e-409e-48af-ae05-e6bd14e18b28 [Thermothielavioides terrestris]|uniref:46bd918e-409e-48af-ae05-e6bd14e18b28 n=1 Tax=Thermothielavioides terrestris TaxID=2587410 RepID=A0A446B5C7_9PEZI|nr:46bd918e-409e-48af-ae05-e6bd14e18b28 [Thermothielavioides terrestris]